jgi:ribosomal protein S12
MSTIKQLVAERRSREGLPSSGSGVCTGVYEIGNDKRVVARVRLATDMEVTAYVPRDAVAPAVGDTVLLRDERGADQPPVRHGVVLDGPAIRQSVVADQPPPRHFVADQRPPRYLIADQPPARSIVADR